MRTFIAIVCFLFTAVLLAGCSSTQEKPSWSVDSTGHLTAVCPRVTTTEDILGTNDTYTRSRIVFHSDEGGDVVTYLAVPKNPAAAFVYVPGAGETPSAHADRMVRYTRAGYAFLYVDIRGNNGETNGLPFGQQLIQSDYTRFENGEWPQYYLTVCDLSSARAYLSDHYHVPVVVMGSSNGGRYAAVAAAVDPAFAGYIGISTSDWGLLNSAKGEGYIGDPLRFASSLEPSTYIAGISPRPVWMFHARADPIIPFENGEQLFRLAEEPKMFTEFNGTHGINPEVDDRILSAEAQIYGTRG